MPRLRRSDCTAPGLRRRRKGKGWAYADAAGRPVTDPETIARVDALVLPPAWTDVWISPHANGHIQAIGTDQRGRRQYRYHDAWRAQRDAEKFDRILDFATALPAIRDRVAADLTGTSQLTRERVLACAVRLLDLGFFRIGGEEYAEANNSYGLATLRRDHLTVGRSGVMTFDYVAKSGKQRVQHVLDEDVRPVVVALKRRRNDPNPELLAYRVGRRWVDVKAGDVNDYLREITGADHTAKDFRTWSATVLAAVALGVSEPAAASVTARKRAVVRAVQEVAGYLGNTPAVCRASYIHPRVIDLFADGITVAAALERLGADSEVGGLAYQGAVEAAVLALLKEEPVAAARRLPTRRAARKPREPIAA